MCVSCLIISVSFWSSRSACSFHRTAFVEVLMGLAQTHAQERVADWHTEAKITVEERRNEKRGVENRVTEREKDLQRGARTEEWRRDSVREQVSAVTWLSGWCQGLAVPQSPPTKFGQNWDYSGGRKAWMTSVCPSLFFCRMHHPPSLRPSLSFSLSLCCPLS